MSRERNTFKAFFIGLVLNAIQIDTSTAFLLGFWNVSFFRFLEKCIAFGVGEWQVGHVESEKHMNTTESIWRITTNIRSCGGGTRRERIAARRAAKSAGMVFWGHGPYLVPTESGEWAEAPGGCGVSANPPEGAVVGVSMGHVAHKIGGGDARHGWHLMTGASTPSFPKGHKA